MNSYSCTKFMPDTTMWVVCRPGSHGHGMHHHCLSAPAVASAPTAYATDVLDHLAHSHGTRITAGSYDIHSPINGLRLWGASDYVMAEDRTLVGIKGPDFSSS